MAYIESITIKSDSGDKLFAKLKENYKNSTEKNHINDTAIFGKCALCGAPL